MSPRLWISVGVPIGILAGGALYTLWLAGQFKLLEPHFEGSCRFVRGVVGPEDITIHPGTGVAYISSVDRRALRRGEPGRGALYAYDLRDPRPRPVNLTPRAAADFHPHGISLFVGEAGRDSLFVVNHASGQHSVEVYDLEAGRLSHRLTLRDPLLVSPNDIVAVSAERFYVTNDHGHPTGPLRVLEEYLRLPLSNVVYYDGARFSEAASGLRMANGINVAADGRRIFVTAVTDRRLHIFEREPDSGRLAHDGFVELGTGGDNIEVDAAGQLWIGAHPKLLDLVAHLDDPARRAPAQVLRLRRSGERAFVVDEIYLGLGDPLSGSSVAAVRGDRLLVGAVADPGFLDCRMR